MATVAKKQFGSNVAARVAAKSAVQERLPRAATAKTADKASVAVKRIPRTKKSAAAPASQGAIVNASTKNDPVARAAANAGLAPAVKTDVPDPTAKVSTPSTAKRITRTRKPVTAADVRATPATKVPAPKVGTTKTDDTAHLTSSPKNAARLQESVKEFKEGKTKVRKTIPAKKAPAKKPVELSPATKKAIEDGAAAFKTVGKTPAAKTSDAAGLKALKNHGLTPASTSETTASVVPQDTIVKIPMNSGRLSTEQQKAYKELVVDAGNLVKKAVAAGFVLRIENPTGTIQPGNVPAASKFENAISVVTRATHDAMLASFTLLNRYDALVKEIQAAGGKVNGDLILDGVVFKYGEAAPASRVKSPKSGPRPSTKTVLKGELTQAAEALIGKAKDYGFALAIQPEEGGKLVVKLYETK